MPGRFRKGARITGQGKCGCRSHRIAGREAYQKQNARQSVKRGERDQRPITGHGIPAEVLVRAYLVIQRGVQTRETLPCQDDSKVRMIARQIPVRNRNNLQARRQCGNNPPFVPAPMIEV